ncbi:hypothetical protein [Marinirhabdus gelatinilytica]|uniref:Uncharacterized protein n=1 Tax=Marinirhabdus gelatinilytica TaxID=1703343 RepID=A0A370QFK9_9FLAO|nr:hypothetical protein [Marinirhabdus gelatinilytica]RDK87152.1 hypothetical protein C8D94_102334 [Marinirhabdus gelatinilytica]
MSIRPYWQFYKAVFPFVMATGLVALALFGVVWGYFLFCTLGLVIGVVGFKNFRKNELYTYYNLGITKLKLFKISFAINLIIGLPIFLVFLSLFLLLFGKTSII